jgi:DNA-binding LytR/AlgR family response regulator
MIAQLPYRHIMACYTQDIAWLKSDRNYTYLYFKNGERQLMGKTISLFERQLNPTLFMRVSRGAIVNLLCVRTLQARESVLWLESGEQIPVSRRRFTQLRKRLELMS